MSEESPPPGPGEMPPSVPHIGTIILMSVVILIGFGVVSGWVLAFSDDATTKGAIVQTWNNLAIAVGAFWLGSSLGGKMKK